MENNQSTPDKDKKNDGRSLHWEILGGNNKHRIGANSGLAIYEETDSMGVKHTTRIMIDAGSLIGDTKYPEYPELAACDNVMADMSRFLKKRDSDEEPAEPIDAIFVTHNHVDHDGALPFYLLMGYELPKIYATPYTLKRLEQDFANMGIDPDEWPEMISIAPGSPAQEGQVKVSPFWVSHSTPQSVGFFIETPEANILHTGDFKLDKTVIWGPAFNEEQFKRTIGERVDLMLIDSTGADADKETIHEHDVRESLRGFMEENPDKRFVIAVMSGYEESVASIAKVASEFDRDLYVSGWSHEQSLSALKSTGMTMSDHVGKELDVKIIEKGNKASRELAEAKPGSAVVMVTGALGTPNSTLPRAADGTHSSLKLDKKKDIILLVAPSIPGQEVTRERMLSILRAKGFEVYTKSEAQLYSHAHARLPEILEMARMVKPTNILPVHGDTHLREANAAALTEMGMKTVTADNGDVLRVTREKSYSINPATKDRPKFTGFKTLQGANWYDKNYMQINAPQEGKVETPEPVNDKGNSKRPKIFNVSPK